MPVTVLAIDAGGACDQVDGGISHSYYVDRDFITGVTATGNLITAMTMSTPGKWARLDYDRDQTSFYNQVGARNGKRISYTQTAFLKFAGYTQLYASTADLAKSACKLVFIHVMTNGARVIQGLELDATAVGGIDGSKIQDTRVVPTLNTDTSANEARLEFNIEGQSKSLSPFTDLTDTEIEAL